ncbi:MAG: hypothetical protein Hals2KO_21240 [Halioglobus sp.]
MAAHQLPEIAKSAATLPRRLLSWSICLSFVTFTWLGFAKGIEGARNIAMFAAWFCICVTPVVFFSEGTMDDLAKRGRTMPRIVSIATDLLVGGIMLWFGAIWTGSGMIISCLLAESSYENSLRRIAGSTEPGQS